MGGHDTRKHGLLVELNVVERLESKAEVSQQTVHAQQPDNGEVSQHAVQVLVTVLASDSHGVFAALHGAELLGDLRPLNERVQDVEHTVAAPGVGVIAQDLNLLLIVGLSGNSRSVGAEGVELVDKLVDDIPSPVILPPVSYYFPSLFDEAERTDGGSRSTGPSEFRIKWNKLQ